MGNLVGTNRFQVLVESVCRSLDQGKMPQTEDFRQLMTQIQTNVEAALPGGNWVVPGGTKATGANYPAGVGFAVTGANGAFTLQATPPTTLQGKTVWYEFSYCALRSFTQSVTTLPWTTTPKMVENLPNQSLFWRMRVSFDQTNWSPYQLASSSAITSGLVSSSATSDAGAFNQTNYGVVTSVAVGSTAEVQIQGANGPYTSMVAQKGPTQSSLPGATIVGVTPGSDQFVGFNGSKYILRSTLADLLSDDAVTPIGKVSVVGTGAPTLPTIVPIISGGHIIGYNVTFGGNGASAPYNLTITDGPGSGATTGQQTIVAGVLIAVAPGNPGDSYDGSTVVTPSGGIFPGVEGGGTAIGGNGGRLTAV